MHEAHQSTETADGSSSQVRTLRRVSGGSGSFGGMVFPFRQAIRRGDETVLVEIEDHPSAVVQLFEAAERHGTAQLCLGSTICRAKPVAWEPTGGGLIFELHRHEYAATG